MAKIVTVHGTFAHIDTSTSEDDPSITDQWWKRDSDFEDRVTKFVNSDGSSGQPGSGVEFHPFVWNGDNSELSRRRAGLRLFWELKALEAQGEKYCVIAHSHGGSVVSAALQESAARGITLDGLKNWVTVGTPFPRLRPERYLFLRLPLLLKALFVASMMLLFMFLFYIAAEFFYGRIDFNNQNQLIRLLVSTILTALPFITFYIFAWYYDGRRLSFYRRRSREKARSIFGDRWLPLTHEDDEAVRGLASIGAINLKIFHKDFAVPAISLLSVFILPVAYLWVIFSPSVMISIADFLKTNVYRIQEYKENSQGINAMVKELRRYRRKIRRMREELEQVGNNAAKSLQLQAQIKKLLSERRNLRQNMLKRYPDAAQIRRAQRFERRFLQDKENGTLVICNSGKLCGDGEYVLLNAKLIFHLVTDEVAGWVTDQNYGGGFWWWVARSAIPILLVPVVFGIAAIAIVLIFQILGRLLGQFLSRQLDKQTWFEIRRSALGNDTETEVVVSAAPSPKWIEDRKPFLPNAVSEAVSAHSDYAMAQSIKRIRAAISEFALLQEKGGQLSSALNYLTWRELIHTSYFEVPEFQKLVCGIIANSDGFQPSATFKADPEFTDTQYWLEEIQASQTNTSD